MALSSEEKLKNFAGEVTGEAKQICDQLEIQAKKELQDKTKEGKTQIASQAQEYILRETEKIKKEKALEIAKANIKSRQDYFKFGGEISSRVFGAVQKKLVDFMESEAYGAYLLQCCKNVMEKAGTDLGIFYMPKDEHIIAGKVRAGLEKSFDMAKTEFIKDETIKTGGLRFFDHAKNVLINDVFEEKEERAKELLNSVISPHFVSAR